jgi:hypothetical protein
MTRMNGLGWVIPLPQPHKKNSVRAIRKMLSIVYLLLLQCHDFVMHGTAY